MVSGQSSANVALAQECGPTVRRTGAPFPWALASVAYDNQLVVQPVDVLQALAADVVALPGRFTLATTATDVRPAQFGAEV